MELQLCSRTAVLVVLVGTHIWGQTSPRLQSSPAELVSRHRLQTADCKTADCRPVAAAAGAPDAGDPDTERQRCGSRICLVAAPRQAAGWVSLEQAGVCRNATVLLSSPLTLAPTIPAIFSSDEMNDVLEFTKLRN